MSLLAETDQTLTGNKSSFAQKVYLFIWRNYLLIYLFCVQWHLNIVFIYYRVRILKDKQL